MTNLLYEKEYEMYKNFGAYTLNDLKNMKEGDMYVMHYNCYNTGSFIWIHETVEANNAIGKCWGIGDNIKDAYQIHLYEYSGFMCVGSGAEPVCREMPTKSCYDNCD